MIGIEVRIMAARRRARIDIRSLVDGVETMRNRSVRRAVHFPRSAALTRGCRGAAFRFPSHYLPQSLDIRLFQG